ncbi:hypothetical protein KCV03_g100, partial [Aureobasidium melanogenum]
MSRCIASSPSVAEIASSTRCSVRLLLQPAHGVERTMTHFPRHQKEDDGLCLFNFCSNAVMPHTCLNRRGTDFAHSLACACRRINRASPFTYSLVSSALFQYKHSTRVDAVRGTVAQMIPSKPQCHMDKTRYPGAEEVVSPSFSDQQRSIFPIQLCWWSVYAKVLQTCQTRDCLKLLNGKALGHTERNVDRLQAMNSAAERTGITALDSMLRNKLRAPRNGLRLSECQLHLQSSRSSSDLGKCEHPNKQAREGEHTNAMRRRIEAPKLHVEQLLRDAPESPTEALLTDADSQSSQTWLDNHKIMVAYAAKPAQKRRC